MIAWVFVTVDGVAYGPIVTDAKTFEDACVDFAAYLNLDPERFAEFALTLNPGACFQTEVPAKK